MRLVFNLPNPSPDPEHPNAPVPYSVELSDPPPDQPANIPKQIWQSWLRSRITDLVARSGVTICGCYPHVEYPDKPAAILTEDNRVRYTGVGTEFPETVSEHSYSCINLARLMVGAYPKLSGTTDGFHTHTQISFALDRLAWLFLYHDSAEAFTRDMPDDGSQPTDKNQRELEYVIKNTAFLPNPDLRARILQDFVHFQYPTASHLYPTWRESDRRLIQFARLIDKGETVLSTLKCEIEGHPGGLMYKDIHYNPITPQDRFYIDLCNCTQIVDTWAAHFLHKYHHLYGFARFLPVLHAGVVELRHEWYRWWPRLCAKAPELDAYTPLVTDGE